MHRFLLSLLFGSFAMGASIPPEEYVQRRSALRKSLDGGLFILVGALEANGGLNGFFQEPNFYYLTGFTQPGALLLMDGESEILFLPKQNARMELYTGKKVTAEDPMAKQSTGFASVMDIDQFEPQLFRRLEKPRKIFADFTAAHAEKYKQVLSLRKTEDAKPLVGQLRRKKSANEIAMIEHTTNVSIQAHLAAWKRAAAGLNEYQVAATMTNIYFKGGCERSAYPPIVGSGPNSVILHYSKNSRKMDSGELLLMDVGAECQYYATDITRTIPINGTFTARQKEIYEIVLGAQKAAIAAIKPGMKLGKADENSLGKIAFDYINTHGKDLKGEPLGKYFTHGLGHHVGLEVHDPGTPLTPLEEGNVITIEPGIYIPEESIGVRIEDTILVTATGSRVLSSALPRDPGEIETLIKARK